MPEHRGYATIVDPDQPTQEFDTLGCGHCNKVIFIKPATASTVYLILKFMDGVFRWVEEAGAFCRCCMKPVCLRCHDIGTCLPLEVWLEQQERPKVIHA